MINDNYETITRIPIKHICLFCPTGSTVKLTGIECIQSVDMQNSIFDVLDCSPEVGRTCSVDGVKWGQNDLLRIFCGSVAYFESLKNIHNTFDIYDQRKHLARKNLYSNQGRIARRVDEPYFHCFLNTT